MAATGGHGMAGMPEPSSIAATAGLRVEWASAPAAPQPGQPLTLRYRVVDAATGRAVTDLPLDHERPMHLILVSARPRHVPAHPPGPLDGGAYQVTTTLPQAGDLPPLRASSSAAGRRSSTSAR